MASHSSVKAEPAGVDEMQQSTQGTKLENKDKADRYYTMYGKSHAWNTNYIIIIPVYYIQASPSKYTVIIGNPSM